MNYILVLVTCLVCIVYSQEVSSAVLQLGNDNVLETIAIRSGVENIALVARAGPKTPFQILKNNVDIAHGTVMGIAVALLFPIGALIMRIPNSRSLIWIHVFCQIAGTVVLLVGFGLGVWTAVIHDEVYNDPIVHTVFGTVIVGLFLVQPALGMIHHNSYKKTGKNSWWSVAHVWFGRIILILAIVNGGVGIQYAANSPQGEIGYGVLAGVIAVAYIGVVAMWYIRKPKDVV